MEILLNLIGVIMAAFIGFFVAMYLTAQITKKEIEKDIETRMAMFGFLLKRNSLLQDKLNKQLKNFNLKIQEIDKKLNE